MSGGEWVVVGVLMAIPCAVLAALAIAASITVLEDVLSSVSGVIRVCQRRRRRHERALRNIERLERELGLAEPPPYPTGAPGEIWRISGSHLMPPTWLTGQEARELDRAISVDEGPWLLLPPDVEVVPPNDRGPH